MGFLFSRRWVAFLVVVAALAFLALRLGDWQFHRLDERRAKNSHTVTNIRASPLPVGEVLSVGHGLADDEEWSRVTATGTWDTQNTVVIRYQTRDSKPGVDVVTPLVTGDGTAVVVDRGWLATRNSGSQRPKLPSPGTGQVTVSGYVRIDGTGGSTKVADLSARAISSSAVAKVVPYKLYSGFVMMTGQTPSAAVSLGRPELPEIDDGPHFFYGLQWWFFGFLAVVGFLYLAYDEVRQRRRTAGPEESGEPHEPRTAGSPATSVPPHRIGSTPGRE